MTAGDLHLGFHRYVNRPWSLFYTTLSSAFLICTESKSEGMPVQGAKACDVSLMKHCRAHRQGRTSERETRDLEQMIAAVLVDDLKWIWKSTEETTNVNEMRKEKETILTGGVELPVEIEIEI